MARCGGGSSSNYNFLAVVGINGRTASAVDDAAVPPPAVLSSLSTRVTILITIICTIAAAQTISNKKMTKEGDRTSDGPLPTKLIYHHNRMLSVNNEHQCYHWCPNASWGVSWARGVQN